MEIDKKNLKLQLIPLNKKKNKYHIRIKIHLHFIIFIIY